MDGLWQPAQPSARQLCAREPSWDWCRPQWGRTTIRGKLFLNFPLLSLFEDIFGANGQSRDHSIRSSQTKREKKFKSPQVQHECANLRCGASSPWSVMWPLLSSRETSPDRERWCRHAQLFGWMMYHRDSGPQSRHVLYLLHKHQCTLGIPDLQLGSTMEADGALTSEQMMEALLSFSWFVGPLSTGGFSF